MADESKKLTFVRTDKIFENVSLKNMTFKKGEKLFCEGDESVGVCKINEGTLVFKNVYSDGHESIIKTAGPGEIFGDVLLFSDNHKYPASIYALTDGRISYIAKEDSYHILMHNPKAAIKLLRIISNKNTALNSRIKLLNHKTIRSRICYYLFNEYQNKESLIINIPFNRDGFAGFLNVERPSLSRELIKMREDGIIDFYLNTVKILDVKALEEEI